MRLLASESDTLRERWLGALDARGIGVEPLLPAALDERLAAGGVELCLVDLGARPDAGHRVLLEAIQHHPEVGFIALAAVPSVQQGIELLQAGLRGYCNRLAAPELIPVVVQTVQAGELWVGSQVAQHLLTRQAATASAPGAERLAMLTPRERQIARMVGQGLSNKLIAARSGITERTVKAHLNAIFRKTGIRNRVQLALVAASPDPGGRPAAQAGA